jgi:hypothetical protein
MGPKRYCKAVLLIALVTLACVSLFNLLIDPIGAYPRVHLESFEPQRAAKFDRVPRAELARRGTWEVAVLGTSRPKIGMPVDHPVFASQRTCNLAVDAARMSEVTSILEYTSARNPVRRILLCLDFPMFRDAGHRRVDFPDSRFNPDLSLFDYHCRNLIGAGATDSSVDFLVDRISGNLPPAEQRNGFAVRPLKAGLSQHALFEKTLRSLAYGEAAQQVATNEMEALRDALKFSRAQGLDLVLAINPVHALHLELLVAGNNWARFEQWKRDVVAAVNATGATNVIVWDFTGYAKPTTETVPPQGDTTTRMKFYFESSHYTPALGTLMLDRIYLGATNDLGVRISTSNIEPHLRRLRDQRDEFAREFEDKVQWVHRLSKQALAARKKTADPVDELE